MRAVSCAIALTALLGACRTAPLPDAQEPGALPTSLAAQPTPIASLSSRAGSSPLPGASVTGAPTGAPAPSRSSSAKPAPPFRTVGAIDDAKGDAGLSAPAYADLARVVIEDNTLNARVTVTVNANVPNPMASDEEMGIGVNLFLPGGRADGDYQLYVVGNADGWLAYFDTPTGFAEFPGVFSITGARVVFLVPWSSMKRFSSARFDTFLDWDRKGAVLAQAGADRAPKTGNEAFRRA
jgi:hypothetical protein